MAVPVETGWRPRFENGWCWRTLSDVCEPLPCQPSLRAPLCPLSVSLGWRGVPPGLLWGHSCIPASIPLVLVFVTSVSLWDHGSHQVPSHARRGASTLCEPLRFTGIRSLVF